MNLLAKRKNVDRLRHFKQRLMRAEQSASLAPFLGSTPLTASIQHPAPGAPTAIENLARHVESLRVSTKDTLVVPYEYIPISIEPEPTTPTKALQPSTKTQQTSTRAPPTSTSTEAPAAAESEPQPTHDQTEAELSDKSDETAPSDGISGETSPSEASEVDESTTESDAHSSELSTEPTAAPSQKRASSGKRATKTTKTPPADADRFEELVERQHRENLMRAWRRTHRYRTVPCPSAPPLYLNEPLELVWSETETVNRRRMYNRKKYMQPSETSPRKNLRAGDQQTPPPLKANRTYHLRNAFAKRKPIMSDYFERHYTAHRKPPFKRFNVKFVN
ncbi:hypothetical protein V9T40_005340 [Parthenolecanium corni]|uniref:Uncharacterized protein n=1 Tax=Parthenolecanium corni TaxID=536013 RepID=A0AAN9Y2Z2_9HEMI